MTRLLKILIIMSFFMSVNFCALFRKITHAAAGEGRATMGAACVGTHTTIKGCTQSRTRRTHHTAAKDERARERERLRHMVFAEDSTTQGPLV